MIFDHIYSYLLLDILPNWCSLIARFVAPLFVFMLIVSHDPSIAYTA
ncbi:MULTISPECIES: hypothetical protein [Lactobacillus]